jgi:hypothetical protein
VLGGVDAWVVSPCDPHDARSDRRRRGERARREPPRHGELVPRPPVDAPERGGPDRTVLPCGLPLQDQIGAAQAGGGIAEEMRENRPGSLERQVRHDAERLERPLPGASVGFEDVHGTPAEPVPEVGHERRIRLERDYPCAHVEERARQRPRACTDVDDEVVGGDPGVANQTGCEPATAKEVLAGRARRGSAPNDHGRPPSSSQRPMVAARRSPWRSAFPRSPDARRHRCTRRASGSQSGP